MGPAGLSACAIAVPTPWASSARLSSAGKFLSSCDCGGSGVPEDGSSAAHRLGSAAACCWRVPGQLSVLPGCAGGDNRRVLSVSLGRGTGSGLPDLRSLRRMNMGVGTRDYEAAAPPPRLHRALSPVGPPRVQPVHPVRLLRACISAVPARPEGSAGSDASLGLGAVSLMPEQVLAELDGGDRRAEGSALFTDK